MALFRPEQLGEFGDQSSDWVALVGALLVPAGLFEITRGRWGDLRPPEGLAESGARGTARVLALVGVGSTQNPDGDAPINGGTYRFDLEVAGPAGSYRQRIFRVITKSEAVRAGVGADLPVAIDPGDRRRIAIVWSEAPVLRSR